MPDLADLFPGYASEWINTRAGRIFARVGGKGPPLLLLHGFSETHVMSRRAAIGRSLHADRRGPAGLRLVGHARERQRSYALHQARDGADHDRGDGAARPCAFCPGRARSRRPRRLSARARSSRPAVAACGAGYPADLRLLGTNRPALRAEDLSLDVSGAALPAAGNAD